MSSKVICPKTNDNRLFSRLLTVLICTAMALYLLFAFVIAPLTARVNTDSTITFPYLPDMLDLALNLINLVAFFVCYALTDYSIYRFNISKASVFIAAFSVATVLKYAMNLISDFYIFNAVPTNRNELKSSVISVIVNALGELAQYAIATLISYLIINKHKKLAELAERNAAKIGLKYEIRETVFPFKKLISKNNPLQRSAFATAFVVTMVLVAQRLYFFIWSLFVLGGISTLADALWSVAGFLADIAFGVIGYFVMIFVFNKCDTQDLTIQLKSENN